MGIATSCDWCSSAEAPDEEVETMRLLAKGKTTFMDAQTTVRVHLQAQEALCAEKKQALEAIKRELAQAIHSHNITGSPDREQIAAMHTKRQMLQASYNQCDLARRNLRIKDSVLDNTLMSIEDSKREHQLSKINEELAGKLLRYNQLRKQETESLEQEATMDPTTLDYPTNASASSSDTGRLTEDDIKNLVGNDPLMNKVMEDQQIRQLSNPMYQVKPAAFGEGGGGLITAVHTAPTTTNTRIPRVPDEEMNQALTLMDN